MRRPYGILRTREARVELRCSCCTAPGTHPSSLRGGHFDRARGSATEAVRPVHVFHICLRMDVTARRDRAHDISHREHRRIALLAIEGGAETVIPEFRAHRLLRIFNPRKRAG